MATKNNNDKSKKIKTWQVWAISLVGGVFLLIANSAYWVSNSVFNAKNFVDIAQPALTSESSREATANAIIDATLNDRPALKNLLDGPLVSLTSGLLGSNQAANLYSTTLNRLHIAVTSKDPKNVEINLDSVKNVLAKVVAVSEKTGRETQIDPEQVPSTVTILDVSKLPNLYQYSVAMVWIGPIAFIIFAILFMLPYLADRSRRTYKTLLIQSGVFALSFFAAMSTGPLFKPPVIGNVSDPNVRIIVENLYNAFSANFNAQSAWLIYSAILGGLISFVWFAISSGYYREFAKKLKS